MDDRERRAESYKEAKRRAEYRRHPRQCKRCGDDLIGRTDVVKWAITGWMCSACDRILSGELGR